MSFKDALAQRLPSFLKAMLGMEETLSNSASGFQQVSSLSPEEFQLWQQNGYLILRRFFRPEQVEKVNTLVDALWQERASHSNLTADIFIGTPQERRVLLRDAPDESRQLPYKLNDLFLEVAEVRHLILDLALCKVIYDLLEGKPMVCNSLSFERGSQQGPHCDTFFMPPLVPNKMLATWIALEDCSLDAGPLLYYPGSHKIEPYRFSHGELHVSTVPEELPAGVAYYLEQAAKSGLKSQKFAAKAGDVFIWHAQLLHGGAPIQDMSLTRKSLVTHYLRTNEHPGDYITVGDYQHYMKRDYHKPYVSADGRMTNSTGTVKATL